MRDLLYKAADAYKQGSALAQAGELRGAFHAYSEALRSLHAVKPQRKRNVLLAQLYLSRYQVATKLGHKRAEGDLRLGYSYARTTQEPHVRALAEELWQAHLGARQVMEPVVESGA